jgi:HTH-type transcriptional regulator, sugar sensing transcriptional regulator
MINELIEDIGLTEREAKTYLALIKLGKTTTGPLSRESSVPSSKIYFILSSLEDKGLANHIVQGKTKYFQGEEPKKILAIFKERERKVESLVKELEKKKAELKGKSSVELFEGIKAIKNLWIALSENAKGDTWRGFGNVDNVYTKELADFYEWWGYQKESTQLQNINILSERNEKIFKERYKKYTKQMKGRFFFSKYYFPHDLAVIQNKVIITHLTKQPIAIVIENELLAESYKKFFDELLESAKPL